MGLPESPIFCIGLHKTGTTSLLQAFLRLGIRTCDGLADRLERPAFPGYTDKIDLLEKHYADYLAFEDVPWPVLWPELFDRWPEARFILTTRDRQAWLKSVIAHFGSNPDPIHEWIYASAFPCGHEQQWLDYYDRHNAEIIHFFSARPQARFLHIAIDDGTPAEVVSERLRAFLGFPKGECVWGRVNSFSDRKSLHALAFRLARAAKLRVFGKRSIRLFGFTLTKDYSDLM